MPETVPSAPTMFGFKVVSVSASMGWGGQGGSCSLSLVDEEQGEDSIPANGTACGFRYEAFSFGGILQRWTYKESQSGRFYDVVLESPAKLLDGVQVILDTFESGYADGGDINILKKEVTNVWNPFAELENYATGGQFGNADVNSAGMPVYNLLNTIGSPQGVLIKYGQGNGNFGGKIKFGESEYTINFNEIVAAIAERAPYYRIKGPVQNLNSILQDLAEVSQVDYFIDVEVPDDLLPDGENGGKVINDPNMRIRVADRGTVMSGVVRDYIDSVKGTGVVISSTVGEELQDVATGRVLIGGPASRWYEALVGLGTTAFSVWGSLGNNAAFIIGGIAKTEYASLTTEVPVLLDETGGGEMYTATMFELRMALGGMQTWETFKLLQTIAGEEPNGYDLDSAPWIGAIEANQDMLNLLSQGKADSIDLAVTGNTSTRDAFLKSRKDQCQYIFNGVNRVASNFYGQVFLVPLPFEPGGINNNLRFISDEVQYEASWEISESAWTSVKLIPDLNFYDGDGKLKSASSFPNNTQIDYSPLGGDHAFTIGGSIATTKGGPDKDIFWIDGDPYCIARAGAQLRRFDDNTTPDFGLTVLALMLFGLDIEPENYISTGKASVQISIPPNVVLPDSIGIPQESRRYTWGPWYASTADNGRSEVEVDSSLRPETFGSVQAMDDVGFNSVFAGLAQMESVESGSLELAVRPEWNMGDRFAGSGPYVTNMDISIGVDGSKTTYKFNTWTPNFGKLAKYNQDRIAKVNKASIAFMKAQRGSANKKPFPKMKFEKTDFSSLKTNGGENFNRAGSEVMNGQFKNI